MAAGGIAMSIILQRPVRRGDEFNAGAVGQDGLVAARHGGRCKAFDLSVSAARVSPKPMRRSPKGKPPTKMLLL